MTPEEQRIAIATACGYSLVPVNVGNDGGFRVFYKKNGTIMGEFIGIHDFLGTCLPDYLGSLDAIAQAEESCLNTPEQWRQYVLNIAKTIAGDHRPRAAGNKIMVDTSVMISAASHIRAEAFLRTLGLWKPAACSTPTIE